MNQVVAERFAERLHHLAVGFEPRDSTLDSRLIEPVRFEVEGAPPRPFADPRSSYRRPVVPGAPRPVIDRHDSCLHALLYQPGLEGRESIDVRIYDHRRRYVPRRLRVPLLSLATVEPAPPAARPPTALRTRRPVLFPGAAYPVGERSTGLRGRVLRGGEPMRWARVEAIRDGVVVGRAHGDDRGDFLLLLESRAAPRVELPDPLDLRVTVSGPATAPVPAEPDLPGQDPLWDLPVEELPTPGDPDPVSAGRTFPTGYVSTLGSTRIVSFRLGRLISGADFQFA